MFNKTVQILPLLVVSTSCFVIDKCNSFYNTEVVVFLKDNESFTTNITGCIERIQNGFKGETITELYATDQNIPKFSPDTIRNMVKLSVASFDNCVVAEIAPGAFRNVPRLAEINIFNGNLTKVHKNVFNDLFFESIRLNNNKIGNIQHEAFSNLPTLRSVFLSNNKLDKVNPNWFTNSTNLQILDLQFNKLTTIPANCFKHLPKLNELHLDYNDISTLEQNAFAGISRLKHLGLRYNRLKHLSTSAFPTTLTITSLLIDANRLNYLANEVLAQIGVRDVTVSGNPWKCPCLDRINYWLYERNGSVRVSGACAASDVPVCVFPQSFSTTCIETVDEEVTRTFMEQVRKIGKLDTYCIRLD